MRRAYDAGLVRDIGTSNFDKAQLEALVASARIRPAVNQIELHVHFQQRQLVKSCLARMGLDLSWRFSD